MCSCVFCLLYSISKGKWWIHLLTILTFFVIPDRFNLVYFKFLYPYYVVGFYWNKQISVNEGILYNMWTTVRRKRRAMITGGLFWVASFAGLLCFFNRDAFIYSTGVMIDFGNAPMRQIGIDVYRWAIGYVGALIPIGTVTLIRKLTDCKWLAYFGARSLGIYITNTYINLYVLKFITWEFQFNWVMLLIETILVTVICCVFAELLRQSKITKKLFLGR